MRAPRVLITRPEGQGDALAARLREQGWEPVHVPAIRIEPPPSYEALDRAIERLAEFDWVLLTSANAVAALFDRMEHLGVAGTAPRHQPTPRPRWAAIGPGTAEALRMRGIAEVWMPGRALSDAVAGEMPARPGQRVLRVRAAAASETPTRALRARGVEVAEAVAYRTVEAPPESRSRLAVALAEGVDAVVFTSASTVRGLFALAEAIGRPGALDGALLAAIGPVTARALEAMGRSADVVAAEHSTDGIVRALRDRLDRPAAPEEGRGGIHARIQDR